MRIWITMAALMVGGCGDVYADRVAFGDSVTFGWGGERGGWVSHLEKEMGEPIANYGVPTEKVEHGRVRFIGPTGPLALAPWSGEILLLHGGNDVAAEFLGAKCDSKCAPADIDAEIDDVVRDVRVIIREARKHNRNVILGTYWRVNAEACSSGPLVLEQEAVAKANAVIDAYDAKLVEMAYDERVPVVRLDELGLEGDAANFYDCIHPSDAGYRQVAEAWRAALSE